MIGNSAILAFIFVALYHAPLLRKGLNLADEGYLWFGIREVLRGRAPIRDFRAYDPGRYYLGALWFRIFGRELLSLRFFCLFLQILELWACIFATSLATGNLLFGGIVGAGITPWLYPRYKQSDSIHLAFALLLAILLESLQTPPYFPAGIFVGYSFFLGLNHGLYCGGAFTLQLILSALSGRMESPLSDGTAFLAGGLIGLAPVIAMLLLVDGYAKAYWHRKILRVLYRKSSNLPIPRPWLWRRESPPRSRLNRIKRFLTRSLFTLMVPVYLALILMSIRSLGGNTPGLLGVGCLGLFYFHHTQSRADIEHLAPSMIPLCMGLCLIVTLAGNPSVSILATAVISSVFFFLGSLSTREWVDTSLEPFRFGRSSLKMTPSQGEKLKILEQFCNQYSSPGEALFAVPSFISLYPLFQRIPAAYDTYCVYPATAEEDSRMVEEIRRSRAALAIIDDSPQDNRDDLRFHTTHPTVWAYLNEFMTRIETPENLPEDYLFFIDEASGDNLND